MSSAASKQRKGEELCGFLFYFLLLSHRAALRNSNVQLKSINAVLTAFLFFLKGLKGQSRAFQRGFFSAYENKIKAFKRQLRLLRGGELQPGVSKELPTRSCSQQAVCDCSPHPAPPGRLWWPFAPHQSSVTLNWTEGKQSARSALCANLQLRCFSLGGRLAGSLHPTNTSHPVAEISSHPASAPAIFCWRVPFFVVSVTKSFTPEMDSALHFDFPANERESYPLTEQAMTELVFQTHLEPFAKRGRWVLGWWKHSSQAQAVVALALLHQGRADCFHFCYLKKNGSVGLTRSQYGKFMVWLEVLGLFCNAVAEHVARSGILLYLGLLRKSCFSCALSRPEE
ncbi:hypothetical protein IHE44_0006817, partial [Lamprotornis superbus]